jgi:hypothetical protein
MAVCSRMLWPASLSARTVTATSGRIYTYAPVLDVAIGDQASLVSAGLVFLGQSGATPVGSVGVAGTTTFPPSSPPGGFAAIPQPVTAPDPNRPAASGVSAGTYYYDAALERPVVSNGSAWIDPYTGAAV